MRLLLFIFIPFVFSCNDEQIVVQIPSTYAFENVNYDGQSIRIEQLAELSSYIKQTNALDGTSIQANIAKDMYGDNDGLHFSNDRLNNSEKQLKNKVLASEQQLYEQIIDSIALYSSTFSSAFSGQAGISSSNNGQDHYLLNPHGIELAQVFEKGLMGACFYYQALSVYLGSGKMDVDNTIINEGSGTAMEHHWDEAYGYFTSAVGIKELDYRGNTPHVWDGVPQDVLDEMGLAYDPAWIEKCVDQEKRNETAVWDEEGNLLT